VYDLELLINLFTMRTVLTCTWPVAIAAYGSRPQSISINQLYPSPGYSFSARSAYGQAVVEGVIVSDIFHLHLSIGRMWSLKCVLPCLVARPVLKNRQDLGKSLSLTLGKCSSAQMLQAAVYEDGSWHQHTQWVENVDLAEYHL